jgi:hypothetical protein
MDEVNGHDSRRLNDPPNCVAESVAVVERLTQAGNAR